MKGFSWIAALTLVVSGHAQQVITVRNQHSRKLIHTLAKDEAIVRGEARLMIQTDGERCEYVTQQGTQFRYYTNNKLQHVLPFARMIVPAFYTYYEKENGSYVVYGKIGQKKIGPYQKLQFYYNEDQHLSDLQGYFYETSVGQFVVDQVGGKTYGPFEQVTSLQLTQKRLFLVGKKEGKITVFDRLKSYGPYEDVGMVYQEPGVEATRFSYKTNGVWQIHANESINLRFTTCPQVRFNADGNWYACGIQPDSDGQQRLFLPDGTTYLHTSASRSIYTPGLPVLTVASEGTTELPYLTGSFDRNKSYILKRGDEVLGEFYIEDLGGNSIGRSHRFYPLVFYRKSPVGIAESKKEFYLLHAEKGFSAPIAIAYRYRLSVGGDAYAYVDPKECALYLNGEKQAYTNVELVDMTTYPESWLMAVKEGYYTTFYKNGKPDPAATLEKRFTYPRFTSRNRPYIFVEENGKNYVKTPQSSKLYGPVNGRSAIVFSANNSHYAEGDERAAQVLIDGKVVGSGYGLVYNKHKNSYHWIEQEQQRLYLHTYELD